MEAHGEPLSPGMGPPPRPPDVFTVLVRTHSRLVRHAAWQAGAPEEDLPDIAQEVFLRFHQASGRLDLERPVDGWLRRTAYTVTRDRRKLARHAREAVTATGELDTADRAPDPEGRMVTDEMNRLVKATLDELPVEQRDVLVMSDMGEMPMPEIVEDLGIPLGTGYSRLRAGRTAFRENLRRKLATGAPAVAPFALWDPGDLLAATRVPPPAPPGFDDDVVSRVAAALAAGLAGPAAATVAGAAAGAKVGLTLTAAQIVLGVVTSVVVGAALHAAFARAPAVTAPGPAPSVIVAARDVPGTAGGEAVASASPPATVAQVTSAASDEGRRTGTASPGDDARRAGVPAQASEVDERRLLLGARSAIERGDPQAALALLARVKSPRLAASRDELRRLARAAQDGGP
jgi:RNA polymerase sigma-70 factor, ECF subfamily